MRIVSYISFFFFFFKTCIAHSSICCVISQNTVLQNWEVSVVFISIQDGNSFCFFSADQLNFVYLKNIRTHL